MIPWAGVKGTRPRRLVLGRPTRTSNRVSVCIFICQPTGVKLPVVEYIPQSPEFILQSVPTSKACALHYSLMLFKITHRFIALPWAPFLVILFLTQNATGYAGVDPRGRGRQGMAGGRSGDPRGRYGQYSSGSRNMPRQRGGERSDVVDVYFDP